MEYFKPLLWIVVCAFMVGCASSLPRICPNPGTTLQGAVISHEFKSRPIFRKRTAREELAVTGAIPLPNSSFESQALLARADLGQSYAPIWNGSGRNELLTTQGILVERIGKHDVLIQPPIVPLSLDTIPQEKVSAEAEARLIQMARKSGRKSIIAGLAATVGLIFPLVTLVLAIYGFVHGLKALRLYNYLGGEHRGSGLAIAGLIINGLWLFFFLLVLAILFAALLLFLNESI